MITSTHSSCELSCAFECAGVGDVGLVAAKLATLVDSYTKCPHTTSKFVSPAIHAVSRAVRP